MRIKIDTSAGTVEIDDAAAPTEETGATPEVTDEVEGASMAFFDVDFDERGLSEFEKGTMLALIYLSLQVWSLRLRHGERRLQDREQFAADIGWTLTGFFAGRQIRLTPIPSAHDQGR